MLAYRRWEHDRFSPLFAVTVFSDWPRRRLVGRWISDNGSHHCGGTGLTMKTHHTSEWAIILAMAGLIGGMVYLLTVLMLAAV